MSTVRPGGSRRHGRSRRVGWLAGDVAVVLVLGMVVLVGLALTGLGGWLLIGRHLGLTVPSRLHSEAGRSYRRVMAFGAANPADPSVQHRLK